MSLRATRARVCIPVTIIVVVSSTFFMRSSSRRICQHELPQSSPLHCAACFFLSLPKTLLPYHKIRYPRTLLPGRSLSLALLPPPLSSPSSCAASPIDTRSFPSPIIPYCRPIWSTMPSRALVPTWRGTPLHGSACRSRQGAGGQA